jgi:hypothetical protein
MTVHLLDYDDLNIVTQQTEESKRAGEVLENLKLGCVSSKDSSDTGTAVIAVGLLEYLYLVC